MRTGSISKITSTISLPAKLNQVDCDVDVPPCGFRIRTSLILQFPGLGIAFGFFGHFNDIHTVNFPRLNSRPMLSPRGKLIPKGEPASFNTFSTSSVLASPWRSPGLLLCKPHARRDADCSDAREENDNYRVVSARNFSGPKQDVTDDQIKECPEDVHQWR